MFVSRKYTCSDLLPGLDAMRTGTHRNYFADTLAHDVPVLSPFLNFICQLNKRFNFTIGTGESRAYVIPDQISTARVISEQVG